jgi:hypothetical protein
VLPLVCYVSSRQEKKQKNKSSWGFGPPLDTRLQVPHQAQDLAPGPGLFVSSGSPLFRGCALCSWGSSLGETALKRLSWLCKPRGWSSCWGPAGLWRRVQASHGHPTCPSACLVCGFCSYGSGAESISRIPLGAPISSMVIALWVPCVARLVKPRNKQILPLSGLQSS